MPLQNHMHLISTDDYLIEHPLLWVDRLPKKFLDAAPCRPACRSPRSAGTVFLKGHRQ